MKKILAFTTILIFAIIIFSSCDKCLTCSYELAGENWTSGEVCDSKYEIEKMENEWMSYEEEFGVSVTCQ